MLLLLVRIRVWCEVEGDAVLPALVVVMMVLRRRALDGKGRPESHLLLSLVCVHGGCGVVIESREMLWVFLLLVLLLRWRWRWLLVWLLLLYRRIVGWSERALTQPRIPRSRPTGRRVFPRDRSGEESGRRRRRPAFPEHGHGRRAFGQDDVPLRGQHADDVDAFRRELVVDRDGLEVVHALREVRRRGLGGQVQQVDGAGGEQDAGDGEGDAAQAVHGSEGGHERGDLVGAKGARVPRVESGASQVQLDVRAE